jgi:hypothetical protein
MLSVFLLCEDRNGNIFLHFLFMNNLLFIIMYCFVKNIGMNSPTSFFKIKK